MSLASDLLTAALRLGCGVRPLPAAGRDSWEKGPLRRWLAAACSAPSSANANQSPATPPLTPMAVALDAGTSRIVFPEPTRSPDGKIRPFKSGLHPLARARPTVMIASLLAVITELTGLGVPLDPRRTPPSASCCCSS